jgi:heme-degrading monooxygenase HmoA
MIARIWRCMASAENTPHYVEHFQGSVFPELDQLNGFVQAYVLRRDLEDGVELTVITVWESMDTIRRFAGDDVERAVVAPAAQAVLRSFDTTVTHHEILLNMPGKTP